MLKLIKLQRTIFLFVKKISLINHTMLLMSILLSIYNELLLISADNSFKNIEFKLNMFFFIVQTSVSIFKVSLLKCFSCIFCILLFLNQHLQILYVIQRQSNNIFTDKGSIYQISINQQIKV